MSESRFDFLRELVKNIPDINVAEEQQGDGYPERRESSEDGMPTIESTTIASNANGIAHNPNGGSSPWLQSIQRSIDGEAAGCTIHPNWKYTKQHSMDSIGNKHQNNYSSTSNDYNLPINYSIKIKVDDKPAPAKLLRMESTPASFGSNNNLASPIVTPNYMPVTTTKLSDTDKSPIINFDFTKIPLLPSAASTSQTVTASNHSHSVSNILKLNEKPPPTTEITKNEVGETMMMMMPIFIDQNWILILNEIGFDFGNIFFLFRYRFSLCYRGHNALPQINHNQPKSDHIHPFRPQ